VKRGDKMQKKILIGLGIAIILVLGIIINHKDKKTLYPEQTFDEKAVFNTQIVVEIKGEVNRPGVYMMDIDERLYSLIRVAGGLTGNAEIEGINFAQKLSDGMVITIPRKQDNQDQITNKISINRATIYELMTLKGIGEARAKSIIDYRNTHGPFTNIEGLLNVPGISETIFNQIKDNITL